VGHHATHATTRYLQHARAAILCPEEQRGFIFVMSEAVEMSLANSTLETLRSSKLILCIQNTSHVIKT
jgi:hypothetical protein